MMTVDHEKKSLSELQNVEVLRTISERRAVFLRKLIQLSNDNGNISEILTIAQETGDNLLIEMSKLMNVRYQNMMDIVRRFSNDKNIPIDDPSFSDAILYQIALGARHSLYMDSFYKPEVKFGFFGVEIKAPSSITVQLHPNIPSLIHGYYAKNAEVAKYGKVPLIAGNATVKIWHEQRHSINDLFIQAQCKNFPPYPGYIADDGQRITKFTSELKGLLENFATQKEVVAEKFGILIDNCMVSICQKCIDEALASLAGTKNEELYLTPYTIDLSTTYDDIVDKQRNSYQFLFHEDWLWANWDDFPPEFKQILIDKINVFTEQTRTAMILIHELEELITFIRSGISGKLDNQISFFKESIENPDKNSLGSLTEQYIYFVLFAIPFPEWGKVGAQALDSLIKVWKKDREIAKLLYTKKYYEKSRVKLSLQEIGDLESGYIELRKMFFQKIGQDSSEHIEETFEQLLKRQYQILATLKEE